MQPSVAETSAPVPVDQRGISNADNCFSSRVFVGLTSNNLHASEGFFLSSNWIQKPTTKRRSNSGAYERSMNINNRAAGRERFSHSRLTPDGAHEALPDPHISAIRYAHRCFQMRLLYREAQHDFCGIGIRQDEFVIGDGSQELSVGIGLRQ